MDIECKQLYLDSCPCRANRGVKENPICLDWRFFFSLYPNGLTAANFEVVHDFRKDPTEFDTFGIALLHRQVERNAVPIPS